jgi:hypothetical protein
VPGDRGALVRGDRPGKDSGFIERTGLAYHSLRVGEAASPTPRRLTTFDAYCGQEEQP